MIAKKFGVTKTTIQNRMGRSGINRRSSQEAALVRRVREDH